MGLYHGIMTPLEVHGVRTPEEYRGRQAAYIAEGRRVRPSLAWQMPFLVVGLRLPAWVTGGKWVVSCDCGNKPSVHPEWQLACCFECGAIYEGVVMPAEAVAIVALLSLRPLSRRGWRPGESIAQLERENMVLGCAPRPVRAS